MTPLPNPLIVFHKVWENEPWIIHDPRIDGDYLSGTKQFVANPQCNVGLDEDHRWGLIEDITSAFSIEGVPVTFAPQKPVTTNWTATIG